MIETKEKNRIERDFTEFSDSFVDDVIDKSYSRRTSISNYRDVDYYLDKPIRSDYITIISRLDEIEDLINTKVAHKSDIVKSKNEIIQEQKKEIEESKDYIRKLLIVLNKKSTPSIFSTLALIGLLISSLFLAYSVLFGDVVLSKVHFIISTMGFLLMFIMARLSSKLLIWK